MSLVFSIGDRNQKIPNKTKFAEVSSHFDKSYHLVGLNSNQRELLSVGGMARDKTVGGVGVNHVLLLMCPTRVSLNQVSTLN